MVSEIIGALGGAGNIREVSNCMTRLRVVVRDESSVDEEGLKSLGAVLGVVHDRACRYEVVVGPGKSRAYADRCRELGAGAGSGQGGAADAKERASEGKRSVRDCLKVLADIFVPLIPGVVAAGLCQGFAGLIAQLVPNYQDSTAWLLVYQMLALVGSAFIPFLSAWVGYRAAERFGATPILGGIVGMVTCLSDINAIAVTLGLYNEEAPLSSVLCAGRGGVLAAIVGALFLAQVEKRIRRRMPDSLDIVLTPLLSIVVCAVPYVLVVMPALGLVSSGICTGMTAICMSDNAFVRMVAGYLGAALFLPLVAAGMHHGLVALYSIQLAELGYVTLYPALAMAGAGQVGAAAALWVKARRTGNRELAKVIAGALPAGVLGVGEPLVYGVTLPLGRPFVTAGIGAGFGGAFVMLMEVSATSWGPSGVLATFLMTAGPSGPVASMLYYLFGLLVSCAMGGIATWFLCRLDPPDAAGRDGGEGPAEGSGLSAEAPVARGAHGKIVHGAPLFQATGPLAASPAGHGRDRVGHGDPLPLDASLHAGTSAACGFHARIRHGDPLFQGAPATGGAFSYTVKDEVGIHARPAGRLVELAKRFDCEVRIRAGEREAGADSIIEVMSLGAKQGTRLDVEARGPDAQAALRELRRFFETEL